MFRREVHQQISPIPITHEDHEVQHRIASHDLRHDLLDARREVAAEEDFAEDVGRVKRLAPGRVQTKYHAATIGRQSRPL